MSHTVDAERPVVARAEHAADDISPDELMTFNEVLACLKISKSTWYNNKLAEEPEFATVLAGRRKRFVRHLVKSYIHRMRTI